MKDKFKAIIIISLISLGIIYPLFLVVTTNFPADAKYNRLFQSRANMLMDQATFEGMKAQLIQLWQQMNTTFKDYSFDETFNTPWYWQQTYENSLRAQVDYFRQLMFRFDEAITEKNSILAGNKTLLGPYSQWYQQTLESLRTEMKREGGITWVIKDAWYLNFAPTVFWEPIQFFMLCVIFAIIIIYVLFGIEGE